MITRIKEGYNLNSSKVLESMLIVPREKFVARKLASFAYDDKPLPIGFGQTISQPYTVAFMTDLLGLKGRERVLEIGTGSGYQSALLSLLAKEVYTVEISKELASSASKRLEKLGYKNVFVRNGSGEWGWPEKAPFDSIIITAGLSKNVPQELFRELRIGGVLVAPLGEGETKRMFKFRKLRSGVVNVQERGEFKFVPFIEEKS